jgi:hypothetical protein
MQLDNVRMVSELKDPDLALKILKIRASRKEFTFYTLRSIFLAGAIDNQNNNRRPSTTNCAHVCVFTKPAWDLYNDTEICRLCDHSLDARKVMSENDSRSDMVKISPARLTKSVRNGEDPLTHFESNVRRSKLKDPGDFSVSVRRSPHSIIASL